MEVENEHWKKVEKNKRSKIILGAKRERHG
jgi:hypothetical protein